jgi:hypothetical protein
MPIRPELRHLYRTPEYLSARDRVRRRAGGTFDETGRYRGGARCEQCGVEDRKTALRACGWWTPATLESTVHMLGWFTDGRASQYGSAQTGFGQLLPWTAPDGTGPTVLGFPKECCRWVGIVLTCAHLNHTPGDDRDDILKLLCQWCHLSNDSQHHKETRSIRKDRERPLLTV